MSLISDRVSEALVRAAGHHDAAIHRSASEIAARDSRPFAVAISRETGTRGPAVARAVAGRLGWQVYDHELLELVARELHVGVELLENVDEHHITWLQECVEAFAAVPAVREQKYVRRMIEVMLTLAARGRCVIVGRGSPFVLPPATTLRVRLSAPREDRITVIADELKLSRYDAARHVDRTDRERKQFVRLHFLHDPADPHHYDLSVNTSQFAVDDCASLIVDALYQKSCSAVKSETRVPLSALPAMA
ncbi:MAG: cytidylate kinase-like family protein [Planctomycetia bacterium]|nr:cytidylate kinase-like family protein [Planctomycetia bacterium]